MTSDVADELVGVTDASGLNVTTIAYDSLGRKLSLSDPDLGLGASKWVYSYPTTPSTTNPLWLVATQTDALAQAISFQYDKLDRMTSKSGTNLAVTYTYDTGTGTNLIGRRASMTDGAGSATYSYDGRGRLISFTRVIGTASYTIATTYDEMDRVLTQTFPNLDKLSYDYGDHGMPLNVNLNGWYLVKGAQYNQLLKPISYPLGNGLTTNETYWGIDHQDTMHPYKSFGLPYQILTGTVQGMTFGAIDPTGNPTSISYSDHTSESLSFSYNELNQLTGMSGSASEGYAFVQGASPSQYNVGNVVTKGSATYTYPAAGSARPHAPTNVSTLGSYTHDANGNRKTDPTYSYTYTVENNLSSLVQGATTVLQNTFDGDGARVVRVASGTTTHFIGPNYEYNVTTQVATTYCPCNGRPVAMKQGATVTYLHHDQLGSLVSATNALGQEVGSARYYPFGGQRTAGSSGTNPGGLASDRLFTGQTRDLGLDAFYWFQSRYLDTTIGKFHTPDTVVPDPGNPQALNRYSYVLNQLLRFTDPSGHMYDSSNSLSLSPGTPTSDIGTATDTTGDTSAPAPREAPTPAPSGTPVPAPISPQDLPMMPAQSAPTPMPGTPTTAPSGEFPTPAPSVDLGFDPGTVFSRHPDYSATTWNVAIPNPYTGPLFGVTYQTIVDSNGVAYRAAGFNAGKSATLLSISMTQGWILQNAPPKPQQLHDFITGWSANAAVGLVLGVGVTWGNPTMPLHRPSANELAAEVGFFTPQLGGAVTYGWSCPGGPAC